MPVMIEENNNVKWIIIVFSQYSVVCNIQCYNSFSSPVAQCNQIAGGIIKMFLFPYIFLLLFSQKKKKSKSNIIHSEFETNAPLLFDCLFGLAKCLRPKIFVNKIMLLTDFGKRAHYHFEKRMFWFIISLRIVVVWHSLTNIYVHCNLILLNSAS